MNKTVDEQVEINLNELNPLIQCPLCKNYLKDARTTVDCLHTCENSYYLLQIIHR
jgi:hypothetical protein